MKKYSIVIVVVLFLGILYFIFAPKQDFAQSKAIFLDKIAIFSATAKEYQKFGPGTFCRATNGYEVNGDFFNIKANKFFVGGGPVGGDTETTYENLLKNVGLTNEQFKYFKNFLDQNDFVRCIYAVRTSSFNAVEFQLSYNTIDSTYYSFLYTEDIFNQQIYSSVETLSNQWYFIKSK